MAPLYLDINASCDASTTLNKEKIEYVIPTYTTRLDEELKDLSLLGNREFISVFTNLSIIQENPLEYIEGSSYLSDDFDILAKLQFKSSKIIKAKIKKTSFLPSIVID